VASLGRRLAELSANLDICRDIPAEIDLYQDLQRRIHALAAAAALLKFARLAEELVAGEEVVRRAIQCGTLSQDDVIALKDMIAWAPALAWGHASMGEPGPDAGARLLPNDAQPGKPARVAQTALVVGPSAIADALATDITAGKADEDEGCFEIERTEDAVSAIDLARALAPDVIVIDSDLPGARRLVEMLASDPLTEAVPILLLGQWAKPEDAAPYVALGVAKTLPKPVLPDTLRRAAAEATATYVRGEVVRAPLGDLTVDQLGARLAEELRRGLGDAADPKGRAATIAFGDGSDVLAVLWGAVARIRDQVTIRSHGKVRFVPGGPEGALPLAPWLGGDAGTAAARNRPLGEARGTMAPSLDKTVVVVADDDPAVTWFLAGVLRAAGAIVHEAHDGLRALEIAHGVFPDLVISDVLMPGMDGMSLCRAIRRDFVLRDVPVILLSWKEDLLQRVQELGAQADGYLRKEASAPLVVQRVREMMRPRARLAERIAAGGEVRGRLDRFTTRTLLALACSHQPSCTFTLRETSFLYEIEIREGRPVRATRTTTGGAFERGSTVLCHLLGVGAGRFIIAPVQGPESVKPVSSRADLSGTLLEQLIAPVAAGRAAQRLLSDASLARVERVEIDTDALGDFNQATPEPARTLLQAIAAGACPRTLIAQGRAPARLVEDVLSDVAAHGAITAVVGPAGADLLGPAIARETASLRRERQPLLPAAPSDPIPLQLAAPAPTSEPPEAIALADGDTITPDPVSDVVHRALSAPVVTPIPEPFEKTAPSPGVDRLVVIERSPAVDLIGLSPSPLAYTPIQPPEALPPPPPPARPVVTLGSLKPPPVAEPAREERTVALPSDVAPVPAAPAREADPVADIAVAAALVEADKPSRLRMPSSYAPETAPPAPPKERSHAAMWILLAVAGTMFAVGARIARERETASSAPAPVVVPAEAPAPTAVVVPATTALKGAPLAQDRREGETPDYPIAQDLPLRPDDKVAAGQGMLEVLAGSRDTIHIDGRLAGNGPIIKMPLEPRGEPYEIRVKLRGEERVRFVLVKEGRLTRLRVAPPWSR
jgi:CheY-like chemotaxis protein